MSLSLQDINQLPPRDALERISGLYEHSDWIVERALTQRPFASIAQLKFCMVEVVKNAGQDAQMTLIRAHPELAGKAMVNQNLTHDSTNEQAKPASRIAPQKNSHAFNNSIPSTTKKWASHLYWP